MTKIILFFIDGIGLGENNVHANPFIKFNFSSSKLLFNGPFTKELKIILKDNICFKPIDVTMGVSGLPQSATGQTALLTGINAAREVGHHVSGFPGPILKSLIKSHGIIKQVKALNLTATSANLFLPNYMQLVAIKKRRHSATTMTILEGNERIRSVADFEEQKAVYQDITNEMLPTFGVNDIPVITAAVAAENLINIAREHNFTLFEYFQTDICGHKGDFAIASKIVKVLDDFILSLYRRLEEDMTLIITSDHGNFEDFNIKTHTYNQVPLIIIGHNAKIICEPINEITDITPTIIKYLKERFLHDRIISTSRH